MTWNPVWPNGAVSVKANTPTGQQNSAYIGYYIGNQPVGTNTTDPATTLVGDHFWNLGPALSGHHRFIQSRGFTVGGNPTDAALQSNMETVLYAKIIYNEPQWFHRNINTNDTIYQLTPSYWTGTTTTVTSSFSAINMPDLPGQCVGEIIMYRPLPFAGTSADSFAVQTGYFMFDGTTVNAWAIPFSRNGSNITPRFALSFGNGTAATGKKIQVALADGGTGSTWLHLITFRTFP